MSMAYRSGLTSVTYCSTWGMLLIGVVNPDKSENGIITTKAKSIACCMVATMDETSSPIPTAANRNRPSPT